MSKNLDTALGTRASAFWQPLDQVLGTRAAVRSLRVLIEHGGPLPASTIAARTGLSRAIVYQTLNRLQAQSLVSVLGQGQSTLYQINDKHPFTPLLIGLYEAERARGGKLFNRVREWVQHTSPRPRAVWLYGSVARGEDRAHSDLDLAIVGATEVVHQQADRLREALRRVFEEVEFSPSVSIISLTLEELAELPRKNKRLWRELVRDAIPVHGPPPERLAA